MDEAERLCDRLIVIDHGRKITEGSPRQLIAEHIEPQVIEVFDEAGGDLPAFVANHRGLAERVETSGETASFIVANRATCWPNWLTPTACATCTGRRIWKTYLSS
jgi:ABC-type multidrug transport system ATPase subunit